LRAWAGFQGRSPLRAGGPSPVFITVNGMTRENAVVRWPWKLMSRVFPAREIELYNLESDPRETRNVVRDEPEVAARLEADVNEWRLCQASYYKDRDAYTRLQPPRY